MGPSMAGWDSILLLVYILMNAGHQGGPAADTYLLIPGVNGQTSGERHARMEHGLINWPAPAAPWGPGWMPWVGNGQSRSPVVVAWGQTDFDPCQDGTLPLSLNFTKCPTVTPNTPPVQHPSAG